METVRSFTEGKIIPFCKYIWDEHKITLASVAVIASAIKIHHWARARSLRELWNSAGKDVVVLHGLPRAKTCPNLSPFVFKLETYLRMTKIQYKYDTEEPMGSKGKTPWITLNGKDYTDSQLIMEFLGKKFNKNFSSHLSEEQKAAARAFSIMTDEHILWGLAWWRLLKDTQGSLFGLMNFPFHMRIMFRLAKGQFRKRLIAQGIGRHSEDEVKEIIRKDIEAISLYLGKKPFLMGNEPCEVDCPVFGMISQFVWGTPGSPFATMVKNDYPNLEEYCLRMKEKFWPDWEQNLC